MQADPLLDMIERAIAEGRFRRLPPGRARVEGDPVVKLHPDHCDRGGRVHRAQFLDEMDRDAS